MDTVLLIILLIISIIMTGLILIQHSEGGALGIGGGGGGGGFMSGRSAASSVSRMTWILGSIFLLVCLALSVIMTQAANERDIIQEAGEVQAIDDPQENSSSSGDRALTNETDSGETTDPLAEANDAMETGASSEEITEETTAEPDTPEDE